MIRYETGPAPDLDRVIDLYEASTLGERRPVGDRKRMAMMMENANLIVTAWDGDLLVGISRSFSDFAYVTYLSDLAVRASHQRLGDRQGTYPEDTAGERPGGVPCPARRAKGG